MNLINIINNKITILWQLSPKFLFQQYKMLIYKLKTMYLAFKILYNYVLYNKAQNLFQFCLMISSLLFKANN